MNQGKNKYVPYFSIVTVCYNNIEGLRKTMDSVFIQDYKDYEYIVIDGGSQDGTKELLTEYSDKIAFWCSEPDGGVYPAMNKAIGHCNGRYLLYLNSGDIFHDNHVLTEVSKIKKDVDFIIGLNVRMDNGHVSHAHKHDIFMQLYTDNLSHQAVFIKKDVMETHKYSDEYKLISDYVLWTQCIILENASYYQTDIVVSDEDMTGLSVFSLDKLKMELKTFRDSVYPHLVQKELDVYSVIYDKRIVKFIYHLYVFLYREYGKLIRFKCRVFHQAY